MGRKYPVAEKNPYIYIRILIVCYTMRKLVFTSVLLFVTGFSCFAEGVLEKEDTLKVAAIPDDSYYEQTQKQRFPVFGQFKETYFITGIPTNTTSVDKHNADIRFQVSLALRLARTENVDILGTYTENGVWNVYDKSNPLVENAFSPGLCVYWFADPQWDFMFGISHQSNGYVNEKSRSVNTAYATAIYSPVKEFQIGGKVWYGYYEHIPGLPHYFKRRGFGEVWATYKAFDNRLNITALVNPSNTFKNYNLECNLSYRLSDKGTFLPSLFVQYRQGYCETLLNFNRYESHIRIGFALELKHGYNSSIH